jgi:hypothetical protein
MRIKLRVGKRYFVTNPDDKELPAIPLTCKYAGLHEGRHLFLIKGDEFSGFLFDIGDDLKAVGEYSDARQREINAVAQKYLDEETSVISVK